MVLNESIYPIIGQYYALWHCLGYSCVLFHLAVILTILKSDLLWQPWSIFNLEERTVAPAVAQLTQPVFHKHLFYTSLSCLLRLTHPVDLCAPSRSCAHFIYLSPTCLRNFIAFPHLSKSAYFPPPPSHSCLSFLLHPHVPSYTTFSV